MGGFIWFIVETLFRGLAAAISGAATSDALRLVRSAAKRLLTLDLSAPGATGINFLTVSKMFIVRIWEIVAGSSPRSGCASG